MKGFWGRGSGNAVSGADDFIWKFEKIDVFFKNTREQRRDPWYYMKCDVLGVTISVIVCSRENRMRNP